MTSVLPSHLIDLDTIKVGDKVKFECEDPTCGQSKVKTWQPLDSAGREFGHSKCRMHWPEKFMVITSVVTCTCTPEEVGPEGHLYPSGCYFCDLVEEEERSRP